MTPYQFVARRMALKTRKKISGPMMLPVRAMPAPRAARTGRSVPQKIGSPTPASGPMRPTLTPEIVWSLMSAPLAFFSSMAAVMPMIGVARNGCVLKNSRWRFIAAAIAGLSSL